MELKHWVVQNTTLIITVIAAYFMVGVTAESIMWVRYLQRRARKFLSLSEEIAAYHLADREGRARITRRALSPEGWFYQSQREYKELQNPPKIKPGLVAKYVVFWPVPFIGETVSIVVEVVEKLVGKVKRTLQRVSDYIWSWMIK